MSYSQPLKYVTLCCMLLTPCITWASGGYDNGTPAGEGNIDIELTLNPGDVVDKGQSYIVWGYGLTNRLDFHGYISHEAGGTDQVYYGLMYNFYHNKRIDLSTAFGIRHRKKTDDLYLPQLLYTIRIQNGYDIIGSLVNVYRTDSNTNLGQTYDVALRIPMPKSIIPSAIRDAKIAIGVFRNLGGKIYPTYSIDLRF